MNVLDLFSGIGGFSLGLERAGMRTVAFCEIEPYCQAVLRKHWPNVPIFRDIRELTAKALADANGWRQQKFKERNGNSPQSKFATSQWDNANRCTIDVIAGGFPCQDISVAGKGAGIAGERSGLWSEYARIIGEVRPRYVIVENVAALLGRGIERVLGDLAALGYDAEWHCIPASAVGAPHLRDRVWIIAYAQHTNANVIRPYRTGMHVNGNAELRDEQERVAGPVCEDVAGANKPRLSFREMLTGIQNGEGYGDAREIAPLGSWWLIEPDVGRVVNGIPSRVDRLRALGNAIVPQIAEIIGRAIMRAEKEIAP